MSGSIVSLSFVVPIFAVRCRYTSFAVSSTLNMRCLVSADAKMIGKSVNGAIRSRIALSYALMSLFVLLSTKSHLLIQTTKPFLFT